MNEPGYLLEVDTLILQQLMMILKLHKLSAKVDIVPDKNFIHITIMMTLPHLMHGWKIFNSNTLKVLINNCFTECELFHQGQRFLQSTNS